MLLWASLDTLEGEVAGGQVFPARWEPARPWRAGKPE